MKCVQTARTRIRRMRASVIGLLGVVAMATTVSGTRADESMSLNGVDFSVRSLQEGLDPYAVYLLDDMDSQAGAVGEYELRHIFVDADIGFQEFLVGSTDFPPLTVSFWNKNEPIKMSESGGSYRDDTVEFAVTGYEITETTLRFAAKNATHGIMLFDGRIDADLVEKIHDWEMGDGSEPQKTEVLTGDLKVMGTLFSDVAFQFGSLH